MNTAHIIIRQLPLSDYESVMTKMQDFTAQRDVNTPDEIWLVQHPPVYTQGQTGKASNVLNPGTIPVIQSNRGGQVTYHGPGQLVVYLLLDLKRKGMRIHDLVKNIEIAVVNTLAKLNIKAYGKDDAPGVYVDGKKIASLGLKVSKGRTYHGLALNVDMDLSPFLGINPCGYAGLEMTQVSDFVEHADMDAISNALCQQLVTLLGYKDPHKKMKKGVGYRGEDKVKQIPIIQLDVDKKPDWMRIKMPANLERVNNIKHGLRRHKLHSVCEEAACPNINECFNHGTATFMILGAICTRRCPFCDVAHGKPLPPDSQEPLMLAETVKDMGLKYVVLTSVDRDDLKDRGAQHFSDCVREIRAHNPGIQIETLVPDFRGRIDLALSIIKDNPPDIFNHNLETAPSLYERARPGANYEWSLKLLHDFKQQHPNVPTKSGLMMGIGETKEQIIQVLKDLRANGVTMLTLGQYLAPSKAHLPVARYVTPQEFDELRDIALDLGFEHAACGPLVRSSYHADLQAKGDLVS